MLQSKVKILLLLLLIASLINCNTFSTDSTEAYNGSTPLFSSLTSIETGIDFSNTIWEDINHNIAGYDYYYNGGGVAIGDINNDKLPDIFFTGNNVRNKLYINKGNLRFEDISSKAGIEFDTWSTGVTMVDINSDGFLDIYVCNSGPYPNKESRTNQLFINHGNETFTEQAEAYGIANTGYSTQASFFDYDKDGDLDLFVMNHSLRDFTFLKEWFVRISQMSPEEKLEHSGNLYRNNGNNTFTNITEAAGLYGPAFGLGLITSDLNHDGWIDIYIANDYELPDYMFINNKDGTFLESLSGRISHTSYFSMGADAADFNNDGLLDLGIVDMTPDDHVRNKVMMASMDVDLFRVLTDSLNFQSQYMFNALQVNRGDGYFSEIALSSGVAKTDWSWSAMFADFDNDGFKDFLVTNGFRKDTRNNDFIQELADATKSIEEIEKRKVVFELLQKAESNPVPNYLFKNNGNYSFEDKSSAWGLDQPSFSNGAAYADLDLDGDLDLIINNIDEKAFVFENIVSDYRNGNHIRFELLDYSEKKPAYNSKITVHHGDKLQYAELHPVRGYQSSVENIIHFGLQDESEVDSVIIEWFRGSTTVMRNLKANKKYTISQKEAKTYTNNKKSTIPQFSSIYLANSENQFKHHENNFDDFEMEILLPHRQSTLGPFIAVGDVNGDSKEDYFVGGAKGQAGQLHIQALNVGFTQATNQPWIADKDCEDMGVVLFDFDGDEDLDLYVASGGGGEYKTNDQRLQDRLYLNDGSGNFKKANNTLPRMRTSSGRVKVADFDRDGDLDLFVAGRTNPGKYPLPADSYILRNDDGVFTDVTDDLIPQLRQFGMVTDATWVDYNGDGLLDLFTVGEWMAIHCFKNTGKGFEEVTEDLGLGQKTGWWYSIASADFDNDGDYDLIAGNIGKNNKFQPNSQKPLHIYCNDFDDNGTLDIVLSKNYKDNLVPIRGKECSTAQMPFVSENYPTFKSFAKASLSDIYGEEKLSNALHYSANSFHSYYIENMGDDGFIFHELPVEAQLAPINAILAEDFNNDGNMDVLLIGNNFQTEVETPKYDAGKGLFLSGNGDGSFETSLNHLETGIRLDLDSRDIKKIHLDKNDVDVILVSNNNDAIQYLLVVDEKLSKRMAQQRN